jgi:hypothetical protein
MSKPFMKKARELLRVFESPDVAEQVKYFKLPVDTFENPDYLNIIERPMDISTIESKLANGDYSNLAAIEQYARTVCRLCSTYRTCSGCRDVQLMFSNAEKYSKIRFPHVYDAAVVLQRKFRVSMNAMKKVALCNAR